jgi:hypothetical protein
MSDTFEIHGGRNSKIKRNIFDLGSGSNFFRKRPSTACAPGDTSPGIKVFLLLFLQKKKILFSFENMYFE